MQFRQKAPRTSSELILNAVERTGNKNIVLSGGYGLNCVANYYYLDTLKNMDINLYVEPTSSDAGTAIGAAYIAYHQHRRIKKLCHLVKVYI